MTTNPTNDRYDDLRGIIERKILAVIAKEKRYGGLLDAGQDVVIPNDIIHEIIDSKLEENNRKLQEQFHHMLMGAMMQKPQQPVRSADDLLKKRLVDAIDEGGYRVENRLVAIIADHAKENNWPKGEAIHQYLGLAYQRLS